MNTNTLAQAANEARGLAMDAVHACNSGHLGLPLGCAEIGAVLFGESMRYYPDAPKWLNRDRFVLSAGHGSMFLYGWLHLSGYAVSRDAVKNFRALHSITPGHPEYHETPGVEATTGPLGQGIGNAVGYALSGKRAAALFNTPEHTIFDQHIFCINGDGCLQEGVAKEAIAFAGHSGLDNLILIYDSNDVTLDAMADVTQSEDAAQYFTSQGWDTVTIDGQSIPAIAAAIETAKAAKNGRPKVIIAKTLIGKGIPEVAGTAKGHGEGGAKFIESARAGLGLPADEHFYVSPETREFFAKRTAASKVQFEAWQATYDAWSAANPELAAQLTASVAQSVPLDLSSMIPAFAADYKDATRSAGATVVNAVAKAVPQFLTGSADLFGSTKNYLKDGGDFSAKNPLGRNIWFGIREHAMGAICNGIAYDGLFRASGATFLVFADYLRGSIRLAALSNLPVTYIFTHDSVGVGEDGPTHQPVETVSGLRVIPNLDVIRPGDAEETAGAFVAAMSRTDGPTALILTRQAIPLMNELSVDARRDGVLRGAYIARKETGALTTILLATGSELQYAMAAATELGEGVRVVSMPCFERFERQSAEYQESVLPKACAKRVSIEAGVTGLWWKYIGTEGKAIGIDRFGMSAPGDVVFKELGITTDHVVTAAK
ncbi:MAG: transketolase [Luteolibacter sp.]